MPRPVIAAAINGGANQYTGAGTQYVVQAQSGDMYSFFIDAITDLAFTKSTDGGLTWSNPTTLITGTVTNCSVWYDRWSGIAAGLIHCAYTDSTSHDTLYRSIDTENSDALGTQTVVFDGASAVASGSMISITRARGGNLYVRVCIDAGVEGGFFRSTDAGATWGARTINEALATTDQMILTPGFAADNQDIIGIFWDASADEISRQLYDDDADTWAETSIAGTMVDTVASSSFPHFAAAVDLTNSQIILGAWSAVDAANADLRCWTITESAITEKTNVVLNGTDDQGLAAIGIDTVTGYWHVWYAGKSDGSETFRTAVNIYMKISQDSGVTWGAETAVTYVPRNAAILVATPRFATKWAVYKSAVANTDTAGLIIAMGGNPRAQTHLGV